MRLEPSPPQPTPPASGGMRAVVISRTYGSGGGEVAARLARRLGWQLLDHEVVVRVAHQLGLSEEAITAQDERTTGLIERVLHGLRLAYPSFVDEVPPSPAEVERGYHEALRQVILAAADAGQAVIVGRGAFALLADRRDVLKVEVVAPLEQRVVYVARREGLDERAARERILRKDQDRRGYVETHYQISPGEPDRYDLTINTAVLTLDQAVDLTCLALEQKAQRLSVPEADLGPASGMPRYPTPLADIPLPQDAPAPRAEQAAE